MKTIKNISMFLAVAVAALFSPATLAVNPSEQASYTYDENSRLTQVSYSNNRKVNFTYDNNGNLTNVTGSGVTGNTVVFSSGGNGKISGTTQQVVVNGASTTPVTAVPDADFHFVDWINPNYTFTDNPLILTNVTDSTALTANFAHNQGTLNVNRVGAGTVGGDGIFDTNAPQDINATASPGNSFINWTVSGEGSISSTTSSTATVTLTGQDGCVFNATANFFNAATNTVTMSSIGGGSYSGSRSPLTEPTPGNIIVYKVSVPADQKFLTATLTNMTGDADIYAKLGKIPSLQNYDYLSTLGAGKSETITKSNPASGDYYFMVYAYEAYSGVTFTATYGTTAPLAAPTLLTASQDQALSVNLTWTDCSSTGATSYHVYRSTYNSPALAGAPIADILSGATITYTDNTAVAGTYYYYWVKSGKGTPSSDFSNTLQGWRTNIPTNLINGTAIPAITGLVGSTKRYQIITPAGTWKLLEIKTSGGTGDCDLTVEKGGVVLKYSVKPTNNEIVQIENPTGTYIISLYANIAYSGVFLIAKYYNTAPLPPATVTASDGTFSDCVAVNWKESAGATDYEVWRSTTTLSTGAVKLADVTDTSYVDASNPNNVLLNTATYYYFIKAKNPAGTSLFSANNSGNLARIPTAPATVAASDGTYFDKIRVTWGAVAGATSYEVYRSAGATSLFTAATKIADVPYASYNITYTYDDMGAVTAPKTAAVIPVYKYWIKANNSNGSSAEKGDTGFIKNTAPAGVLASSGTYFNQVKITWTAVPGATGYNVYRKTNVATITGATAASPCEITAIAHGLNSGDTVLINGIAATGTMATLLNAKKHVVTKPGPDKFSVPVNTTLKTYTSGGTATVTPVTPNPKPVPIASVTDTFYYDSTAAANVTYTYWVDADYNVAYQSNLSLGSNGKITSTVPATLTAPLIKSVSKGELGFIKVTWGDVPLANKYLVMRRILPTDIWKDFTTTDAYYVDSAITSGVTYSYQIKAQNDSIAPTKESNCSAIMSGYAGAGAPLTNGLAVTGLSGAKLSENIYFIDVKVPPNCTRLVAKVDGVTPTVLPLGTCDIYAKIGSYPTTTLYTAKGALITGTKADKSLTVTNPVAGRWYFLVHGGTNGYATANLTVNLYTATNIVITLPPADDQIVPFTATFKGRVLDDAATPAGIPGLNVGVRDPLTGLTNWITTKTDLNGYFTYSTQLCTEGEYTYDFYLSTIPDNTTSIASYTVKTKRAPSGVFDFAGYMPAKIVSLSKADVGNLQTYMNARRGFEDGTLAILPYEDTWVQKTLFEASSDTNITGKLDSGLYMLYYGTESAAVGNCGITVSAPNLGLKASPLLVRVASDIPTQTAVLDALNANGLIDNVFIDKVNNGGIGVVVVTGINNPDEAGTNYDYDISLYRNDQMGLLANIAGNRSVTLSATPEKKYGDKTTKLLDVIVDAEGVAKKIGVQVYSFTE